MKKRKSIHVDVNQLTCAEVKCATLHPLTLDQLHQQLVTMEQNGKVCRLPTTILEYYNITIKRKIYDITNNTPVTKRNKSCS